MPEQFITPEPTNEMSLSDKFVGILSSPGEVFQSIVGTEPKTSNWSLPLVFTMIIGIIFTFVVFTQPAIQDQMVTAQHKAMEKRVADGKMTPEQMSAAEERNPIKPGTPTFLIIGAISVIVVTSFSLFAYAGIYFLGGKFIVKSTVPYMKIVEVYGLTLFVGAITALLTMIIVVAMSSLYASLSPTLFITDFDPTNKVHKLMSSLNLLEFWVMYVVGVGLSKVWNTSLGKSLGIVCGVWVIWTLIKVFVNFGF